MTIAQVVGVGKHGTRKLHTIIFAVAVNVPASTSFPMAILPCSRHGSAPERASYHHPYHRFGPTTNHRRRKHLLSRAKAACHSVSLASSSTTVLGGPIQLQSQWVGNTARRARSLGPWTLSTRRPRRTTTQVYKMTRRMCTMTTRNLDIRRLCLSF
jgi:hypothetical protein